MGSTFQTPSSLTGVGIPPFPLPKPRGQSSVSTATYLHEQMLFGKPSVQADDEEEAFLAAFRSQWEELQARKLASAGVRHGGPSIPPVNEQSAAASGKPSKKVPVPEETRPPAPPASEGPSESRGRNSKRETKDKAKKKSAERFNPPSSSSSDPSSSSSSSGKKRDLKKKKKNKKKRKPSSSSSSSSAGGKVSDKMNLAAYPTAPAKRQWQQSFRLEVVSCSKMSKRRTLEWILAVEKKGSTLEDFAVSGKGFGKLDCIIASALTKLFKGEVAREVSTQAEKLLNERGTLLTGRQLAWIMNAEFAEDLKRTLPHAIADLSKLTVKGPSGLEHWLTSFNSIVDLNADLQPDFITYHAFEQLRNLDVLKTDREAFERLDDDDPAKNHKFLLKAVKKYIRQARLDRHRAEIQVLNNGLPPVHANPSIVEVQPNGDEGKKDKRVKKKRDKSVTRPTSALPAGKPAPHCFAFAKGGTCKEGANCKYAHIPGKDLPFSPAG